MAAKLEGGAYLSLFVDAISEELSSTLEDDSVLHGNDSALELLQRLDDCLCDVGPVPDDSELKQFNDKRVKKWLVDLQDALCMADDLLDELFTKAATATPRDPGKLGLEKSAKLDTSWRIPSTSLVVSSDIFGRDEEKGNIIKLLLDDTCNAESLVTVIPIVGMGGLGKATLVQWVYNDAKVVEKFALEHGILLTTHSEKVASVIATNNMHYRLGLLSSEDCWSMFLMHSSISTNSKQCATLEPIGQKIVEKCKGLPLAVKTLGGLLRNKYNEGDWENILECKIWELSEDNSKIVPALRMLPSRMQDLVNLCHLDIRDTFALKEMPKEMSKLKNLNFLSDYIVGKHEKNGIIELEKMDNLHGSFCISQLENVKNSGEALKAKMGNKKHINSLTLKWFSDGDIDDAQIERDILDKLQPHQHLKELSIEGFRGETFPKWLSLSCFSGMTKLSLMYCKYCCELPSLGQLPSLKHLEFSNLVSLKKIDFEIYNKSNGSFQQKTLFKSLEILKFEHMSSWREWHFPEEFDIFPQLRILEIIRCPVLRGDLPSQLPALEELTIVGCEELACTLPRAPKLQQLNVEGYMYSMVKVKPHDAVILNTLLVNFLLEYLSHIQPPCVQCLYIGKCCSAISISADYLPPSLRYLQILKCSKLTFLDPLQHKWLTKIFVKKCDSVILFPLGALPKLKKLTVFKCQSMECVVVADGQSIECVVSLPPLRLAAPFLEKLCIQNCPEINCFAEECLPPCLKKLEVTLCEKLAKGLQSEGLTHFILEEWNEVKSFPREGCLPASLQSLELCKFSNLETLDCKGLHHLTSLENLAIKDCKNLVDIIEENLLASIANIYIGEECPLRHKLEEMDDPRI
ncbi:hypothetical protein PIB30_069661 [Stylosanthes scabra]|uniref:Uncharacterized protein n=1 Tax=Stylosanthes scabra TaxID=79078 RepID=A0ABU6ZLY0_9FABA|nr:hypothetical protein [Stylosanthes scabra]